jgi:hypothetical protein
MANRLLRYLAVKVGAGLAIGLTRTPPMRQPRRQAAQLKPILTRIQEIESRVRRVELAPPPKFDVSGEEIAALGTLVSSHKEDIADLHEAILRAEHRNAEQVEAFEQKVALVEQLLPAHIDACVDAKMAELEQRVRDEFQEIHYRTVAAFDASIESRLVGRITALETTLVEQSQALVSLREKSLKTDDNLQRLLAAVEKLCARAEAQAQMAMVAPPPVPESPNATVPESPKAQESLPPDSQPAFRRADAAREPESAFAGAYRSFQQPRRAMQTVGVAILGIVFLGFRLFR